MKAVRLTRLAAWRLSAAALALCSCLCADMAVADSTDDAVARANSMAYESAMKCFVVNGIASGDYQDRHDTHMTGVYEAKARASFDAVLKMGHILGYSNERVSQDFDLAQTRELPRMLKDSAYYRSTAATCKALGLM